MARPREPIMQRCEKFIDRTEDCWVWTGNRYAHGYGCVRRGGKDGGAMLAHRAVYEQLVGPVPVGKELHHTCSNKLCVNPEHLLPVTRKEHCELDRTLTDTCRRGHPRTPENICVLNSGYIRCLACQRLMYKERRARAKNGR